MSRPRKAIHRFFSRRTPGALRRLRDAGDEGFTLIELAIVMIIMPLVLGALFYAIFVTIQSEAGVSTKVTDSVDSQISSEFYVRDVQSATLVTLSSSATSPTVCGSGTPQTLLVSLSWPNGTDTVTGKTVVSYWKESGGTTLVRDACKTGSPRPSVTTSRDFSSTISAAHIACVAGKPNCATATTPTSATHKWIPAQWASTVSVAVAEPKGKYRYNLSAAPRVSNVSGQTAGTPTEGGSPTTPSTPTKTLPTLFLLGSSGTVITLQSNTTTVTVKGTTAIKAGGYITKKQSTTHFISTKGETTGSPATICKTSGPRKCKGGITPPASTWTPVQPLRDPLTTLPDPPKESLGTDTGCPQGTVTTLNPGRYTCAINVHAGTTLVLKAGPYEFEKSISIKNASLTGKAGVFIYFPCTTVDRWATGCSEKVDTAGGTSKTTISMSPITSGPYAGIWFWQNARDTSALTIHAKTHLAITGILYAPGATKVSFYGGPGLNAVGAIVAQTLLIHNGTFVLTGF